MHNNDNDNNNNNNRVLLNKKKKSGITKSIINLLFLSIILYIYKYIYIYTHIYIYIFPMRNAAIAAKGQPIGVITGLDYPEEPRFSH